MTQFANQFAQSAEVGMVDMQSGMSNVINCAVSQNETGTILAGEPVKLEDSAGGVPKVLKVTANTDKVFGFAVYNSKDAGRTAGQAIEIAINGTYEYLPAGGAIARGGKVEVVASSKKVITSAGVNPVVGFAMDKAAADGDLIRVHITTPNSSF